MIESQIIEEKTTTVVIKQDVTKKRFIPKSKSGCLTCRQRKIKCDEGRPVCSRCKISRRKCTWPFIASYQPPKPAPAPASHPQISGSADIRDLIELIPLAATVDKYSSSKLDYFGFMLSYSQRIRVFIYDLPGRTGYHEALDAAVKCVASALRHLVYGSAQASSDAQTLALYGDALRKLQASLNDPNDSKSAHTLCATQLLFLYEAICANRGNASIFHAQGATRLIEHRGVEEFASTFDKALLMAQAPITLAQCVRSRTRSSLGDDQWQRVMLADAGPGSNLSLMDQAVLVNTAYSCPWPTLIVDTREIVVNQRDNNARRLEVLGRVLKCRDRLLDWYGYWGPMVFKPETPDGTRLTEIAQGGERVLGTRLDTFVLNEAAISCMTRLALALGCDTPASLEAAGIRMASAVLEGFEPGGDVVAHNVKPNRVQLESVLIALGMNTCYMAAAAEWQGFVAENEMRYQAGELPELVPVPLLEEYYRRMGIGSS